MANNKATIMLGSVESPVRISYPHVFRPHAMSEGQPEKYSCAFLIDKNDKKTIKTVENAIEAAIERGKEQLWKGKVPKNLKTPLRDGDKERDGAEYAGMMFLNANSNEKPGVVGRKREPLTSTDEFYPGCYARATVTCFPYDTAGNRGIGVSLGNIQKIKDGENLTGRTRPEDDFDILEDEFDEDDLADII